MTSHETDEAVARARGALDRVRLQPFDAAQASLARRRGRGSSLKTKVALIVAANVALLLAGAVVGIAGIPLGIFGALAVLLAMAAVTLAIAFAPVARPIRYEKLAQTDIRMLPAETSRWLDQQRAALPAPAVQIADRINLRLDTLGTQLAGLDAQASSNGDIRRLVGEQLPDFVRDYQRVPRELRAVERNGKTPDRQLIEGLETIEREIGQMTEELARGDLDTLETRGRFLEMKYKGDDA